MTRAEAIIKIEELLPIYNNGWKPDWGDYRLKACIARSRDDIYLINSQCDYHLLAFNSWGARNKFITEQEHLIRAYLF